MNRAGHGGGEAPARSFKFAPPCPCCGGPVHRELGLISVLAFFLPVHFLSPTRYRCSLCGAAYTSNATVSSCLLISLFGLCIAYLGKAWPVSLFVIVTWLPVALWLRKEGKRAGEGHTILAGLFLSVLWVYALAVRADWLSGVMAGPAMILIFPLFVLAGIAFGFLLLHLDGRYPPRLRPTHAP